MLLVLDTSVILKWYKDEIYTQSALKIRDEFVRGLHKIIIPDLVLYEMINALRYSDGFTSDIIKESLKNLVDMGIDIIIPTTEMLA
jgi:predicted nucleic acid-binding protein